MDESYEPFPIYDFASGLHLDKKPWLIPKDAFSKVINAYLYQGILRKRLGYGDFGRMVHAVEDEALGTTVDLQLTYSGTLTKTPLRPGDLVISTSEAGETFTDNGNGTLTGDGGGSGTIDYTTGAWSITYGSNPGGGHSITADYDYFPELAVVGIRNYNTASGVSELLAFDTKRLNKYETVAKKFEDATKQDEWTGGEENFIWTVNWLARLFICNNKDRVKSWNGTTLSNLMMDIDNDGINEVDHCLLLFVHKERLIALRTSEDGQIYPQRARACKPGNPDNWKEAEGGWYGDAPTTDWIMGGGFLGDDIIVFFTKSIWVLKYTGNPNSPFAWLRLVPTEGCAASFSVLSFAKELFAMSPTSIMACDGYEAYAIDQKIPDLILEANPKKIHYTYGATVKELRLNWWLYPYMTASVSDRCLVLNYLEKSWSIFQIQMHIIGFWAQEEDLCWDDVEESWDELEMSWDEKSSGAGYPITLGGTIDGWICHMNKGGSDRGTAISFEVEGGRWNPYVEKGAKAKFGMLDFFVTRDPDININIDFYIDQRSIPYRTITINCGGDEDKEKVWKRVNVGGVIGNFHKIKIYHTATAQTPEIHCIMPWFRPVGRQI